MNFNLMSVVVSFADSFKSNHANKAAQATNDATKAAMLKIKQQQQEAAMAHKLQTISEQLTQSSTKQQEQTVRLLHASSGIAAIGLLAIILANFKLPAIAWRYLTGVSLGGQISALVLLGLALVGIWVSLICFGSGVCLALKKSSLMALLRYGWLTMLASGVLASCAIIILRIINVTTN